MRTLPTLPLLALTALVLAAGCGEVAVQGDPQNIGSGRATLRRSRDCNELVADLRADVVAKINKQIDSMADAVRDCRTALGPDQAMCNYYLGGGGYATDDSDFAPPRSAGEADNSTSGAPTAGSPESGEKPAYSDTNTQVAGVDEADIVKTDGQRLFVLHGNTFRVMQAYPMDSLAELSVTTIEGTPSEMYVENGLVVIFSQVDGAPVYAAAGVPSPNQGQSGDDAPIAPGGDYRGG